NIIKKNSIQPNYYYLFIDETAVYRRVKNRLESEVGAFNVVGLGYSALEVRTDLDTLVSTALGIDAARVNQLRALGYAVVPALTNTHWQSSHTVKLGMESLRQLPINLIVFSGDHVLGYPHQLGWVEQAINNAQYTVGVSEFTHQPGMKDLINTVPMIRIHDGSKEALSMTATARRYARAVKERNVRFLIIRPNSVALDQTIVLDHTHQLITTIRTHLESQGYTISADLMDPYPHKLVLGWAVLCISWGIAAVLVLLVQRFCVIPVWGLCLIALSMSAGYYAFIVVGADLVWRQIMSLLIAIVYPVYALTWFPVIAPVHDYKTRLVFGLGFLVRAVLMGLGAGLLIQALMYDSRYLLNLIPFYGVKLAIIFPIVLIGLYFYIQPHRLSAISHVLRRVTMLPVNSIVLGSAVFAVCFLGFYLLRSGNYISWAVPGVEHWMRGMLEDWLFVRPRTKEFLVGYPMLLVAYVGAGRWISKKWLWFFLTIGSVALISMVNSFCHMHTPFLVSVYRSVLGLCLGSFLGFISVMVIIGWRRWIMHVQ
ncbi:MAG: DUF5693 family protein, partial [Candidatus Marinamargulisbacteria bacterium]|nr:DUF5693 family protein [Candidatus Marinamargulisbacteria bacterium]